MLAALRFAREPMIAVKTSELRIKWRPPIPYPKKEISLAQTRTFFDYRDPDVEATYIPYTTGT